MKSRSLVNGCKAFLAFLVLFALAAVARAEVQPETGLGLPRDVSVDGNRIDWLLQITMVFVAILFVIMVVWMFLACLKHNRNHQAEYDHGDSKHHVTIALTLSAIIFFVVDGNLFYNSTKDLGDAFWNFDGAEARDPVRIEINAHQWAWDARYAGPDKKFNTQDDIVTLNDIRVPVGSPVIVELASVDVIHSLYLPNLRVKQDAMPGMVNRFWFEAKETGEFDIACAQHCGVNHYKMKGKLTILSREDYAHWADEASKNSARAYDPADDEFAHWGWDWRNV
ncbi:MAG: cytochrome C oxidase subunit II [Planctomycetes bacterium]|nr:cytochrome C oxidase subunit II [Planctomycetota bacterium]